MTTCAVVTKSGNLNLLEPSGLVQACNGTALPLERTQFLEDGYEIHRTNVGKSSGETKVRKKLICCISVI